MTHKEADLALHPVVGVVLQVGITKKFSQTFCFESLDFFPVSKQDLCFTAIERMEVTSDRRVQLELACEADGAAPTDPV